MAYTSLSRPIKLNIPFEGRIYPIGSKTATETRAAILTLPFDFPTGDHLDPTLQAQLQSEFNAEVETGLTYPYEETMTPDGFQAYFLAFDFVLGIFLTSEQARLLSDGLVTADDKTKSSTVTLSSDRLARIGLGNCMMSASRKSPESQSQGLDLSDWANTYAFSYYIKPNYPGRSSHLCNAGFIVSAQARGLGLGLIAGRSFLYYGPACGYRGSVFNLVYTSNQASVRIWDRLGFEKVGRVPKAGRLMRKDEHDPEYVDAWVVYGDFEKLSQLHSGSGT